MVSGNDILSLHVSPAQSSWDVLNEYVYIIYNIGGSKALLSTT